MAGTVNNIGIGSRVRMTRRPFFRGTVMLLQPSLFEEARGRAFCRWHFKPEGWMGRSPVAVDDLELVADIEEEG